MMLYKKLKIYIEDILSSLDKELTYHNSSHTLTDVLPAAIRLACDLTVNETELLLLKTAILFHDSGYLKQYNDNEFVDATSETNLIA